MANKMIRESHSGNFEAYFWKRYPCAGHYDRRSSACKKCGVKKKCRERMIQDRKFDREIGKICHIV